jgi:hypothetical protein
MEPVAAGDDVAGQLMFSTAVLEADDRRVVDAGETDIGDRKAKVAASVEAGTDEVLNDFLLTVDGNRPTVRQFREGNTVTLTSEAQFNAMMDEPLALEPISNAHPLQQIDRTLLKHAGTDATLDVCPITRFKDDRVNARLPQQFREHQPSRTRPDNCHLCQLAHHVHTPATCITHQSL